MTDNELNEKFAQLAVAQSNTAEEVNKFVAGLAVSQAKTDEKFKQTEAQMAKTDKKLKSLGIYTSNIADNNGASTEDYFFNSLFDNPVLGGITYHKVKKNIHSMSKRLEDEFDIVMYNGDSVAIIECKYKAHENDLRKLIDKKVNNFRSLFLDYQDYKIYLGLASFSFYDELEEMAKQNGVAILKQKGDIIEIKATNLKAY